MSLRHPEIMRLARRDGRVTVDGLVAALQVTPQTIRRDLSELADAGQLNRVHGGAVLPSSRTNLAWLDRRALAAEGKIAIAAEAARLIPGGSSLFLNIGTTTEAVAQALNGQGQLMVITNNLNVAQTLSDTGADVIVTGGHLRAADAGLVGDVATETVQRFRPDWAVIGCSAVDPVSGAVLDYDPAEVAVARAMLSQARRTMLVADATKLARTAPMQITTLTKLDYWVTDQPVPSELATLCDTAQTHVVVAPSTD